MHRKWKLSGPNGQGSGAKRRLGVLAAATLVLTGAFVGGTIVAADAHTPSVTPNCDPQTYSDLQVTASSYNADDTNTVSVTIDGTVLENKTVFGSSFSKDYQNLTNYESHSYTVQFTTSADPDTDGDGNGPNGWTKKFTGTIDACATPPTTSSPDGSVKAKCTGAVIFTLDNSASDVTVTYETVIANSSVSYDVAAGVTKTVVRHGQPGQHAVLWGPADVQLDETTVPRKCAVIKPAAHIVATCTGHATATLNNKASNRHVSFVLLAGTKGSQAPQGWQLTVPRHQARKFHFDHAKFKPHTVLRVYYKHKLLDRTTVPPRCHVPSIPPDTGQRTSPTAKATTAPRLLVPVIGVNARIVQVGMTKAGGQAVTHSVSDVFPLA